MITVLELKPVARLKRTNSLHKLVGRVLTIRFQTSVWKPPTATDNDYRDFEYSILVTGIRHEKEGLFVYFPQIDFPFYVPGGPDDNINSRASSANYLSVLEEDCRTLFSVELGGKWEIRSQDSRQTIGSSPLLDIGVQGVVVH